MSEQLQSILVKLAEIEMRIGHNESTIDSEKDTRKRTTRYLMERLAQIKEKVTEMQRVEAADEILKTQTIQTTKDLTKEIVELKVTVRDLKNESDTRKKFRAAVVIHSAALVGILIKIIFDWATHK